MTVSFAEAVTGGTRRVVLQNGEQIDVKIPLGVKDGQQIRVKGRGGAGRGGGANGDILIQVRWRPIPIITRDGNDLRMDLPVTLKEAVLGGKVPVPTLTGTVDLTVPAEFQHRHGPAAQGQGHRRPWRGRSRATFMCGWWWRCPTGPIAALKSFVEGWRRITTPAPRCAKYLARSGDFCPRKSPMRLAYSG